MKIKPLKHYIVFENDDFIAINKPSGIASLHDRFGSTISVQQLAEKYCKTAQLCHRLDKETSGILLIAKNPETYRAIAMSFENRTVQKVYHAVSEGRHYFQQLRVDLPLAVTSRGRAKIDKHRGKPANTHFSVLETFRHFSLIECRPVTGRLHQIRIHLGSQNAPIAHDSIYGGNLPYLRDIKKSYNLGRDKEERPMIGRTALHAYSLKFELNGETHTLAADYPKDLNVFVTLLRKYDAD
ncbi:MAG: RluA family pseudouridine synthase [Bacteroidia bacterium]|nr:RluA family pseudouridine synthase [Bacteroidia bacterium]